MARETVAQASSFSYSRSIGRMARSSYKNLEKLVAVNQYRCMSKGGGTDSKPPSYEVEDAESFFLEPVNVW